MSDAIRFAPPIMPEEEEYEDDEYDEDEDEEREENGNLSVFA